MNRRNSASFSRRQALRGLGLAGAATPLLPMFEAFGQVPGGSKPIRFLLVFQPNGMSRENWLLPDNSFGKILAPLTPVKDQVVILKNLTNKASGGGADPHVAFGAGATTGRPIDLSKGAEGTGESIDHVFSRTIGKDRPRKLLGMRGGKNAVEKGHLTYSGPHAPVPYETDIAQVFGAMFAGAGPAAGGDPGATDPQAAARLRARKKSVLDVIAGDLALVQSKLGTRDKAKLDAHLTSVRELENSLAPTTTPTPTAPTTGGKGGCQSPNITVDAGPASSFQRWMNLTMAAFACDHTRVATYQWGGPGAHLAWKIPGANPVSGAPGPGQVQVEKVGAWTHHNLDHGKINGGAGYTGELLGAMRVAIMTYYMTQFAWLIQRLKDTPEGQGTMLDNTVVVWMNESSGNGHNGGGTPFMIAGAANKWRSGRVVDVMGASQNDAWMSVAQLLGVPLPQFGHPEWQKGAIAGLVG